MAINSKNYTFTGTGYDLKIAWTENTETRAITVTNLYAVFNRAGFTDASGSQFALGSSVHTDNALDIQLNGSSIFTNYVISANHWGHYFSRAPSGTAGDIIEIRVENDTFKTYSLPTNQHTYSFSIITLNGSNADQLAIWFQGYDDNSGSITYKTMQARGWGTFSVNQGNSNTFYFNNESDPNAPTDPNAGGDSDAGGGSGGGSGGNTPDIEYYDGNLATKDRIIYAQNGENNIQNFEELRKRVYRLLKGSNRYNANNTNDKSSFSSYERADMTDTSLSSNEKKDYVIKESDSESNGTRFASAARIIYDLLKDNRMQYGNYTQARTNILGTTTNLKEAPDNGTIIPALNDYFTIINYWNGGQDGTDSRCNGACTGFCYNSCSGQTKAGAGCNGSSCSSGADSVTGSTYCSSCSSKCINVCKGVCITTSSSPCGQYCGMVCLSKCGNNCSDKCTTGCTNICSGLAQSNQ